MRRAWRGVPASESPPLAADREAAGLLPCAPPCAVRVPLARCPHRSAGPEVAGPCLCAAHRPEQMRPLTRLPRGNGEQPVEDLVGTADGPTACRVGTKSTVVSPGAATIGLALAPAYAQC